MSLDHMWPIGSQFIVQVFAYVFLATHRHFALLLLRHEGGHHFPSRCEKQNDTIIIRKAEIAYLMANMS